MSPCKWSSHNSTYTYNKSHNCPKMKKNEYSTCFRKKKTNAKKFTFKDSPKEANEMAKLKGKANKVVERRGTKCNSNQIITIFL